MTADTLTLADFILARVAEDERDARAIADCEYFHGVESDAEHEVLRLSDPARVLAQCKAHRAIVEMHSAHLSGSRNTLRALAAIWSDHKDWREDWSA